MHHLQIVDSAIFRGEMYICNEKHKCIDLAAFLFLKCLYHTHLLTTLNLGGRGGCGSPYAS